MTTADVAARLLRTRSFVRAPIWLFRHGLGGLCGRRVLMLEHVGRMTGQARFVCLEVVERPSPDAVVVVSGFGDRAQWFRNLQASSRCFVTLGRRRRPAHARFMTADEAAAALDRYQRAYPRSWRRLRGALEAALGHRVDRLPMVELTLS